MTLDKDADDWQALGFVATLTKPVRQADLLGMPCRSDRRRSRSGPGRHTASDSTPPMFDASVLVAEDNPVNQELVCEMLKILGCRVTVVEDGQGAIDACTHQPFDVVLMDCQMPEVDGFAATAEIRRREAEAGGTRMPIVALTANAMCGDREHCLAAGMDDYLSKPFRQSELSNVLARSLPDRMISPRPDTEPESSEATPSMAELDQEPLEVLRSLERQGAAKLVSRTIGKFVSCSEELLDQISSSADRGDAVELGRAAHSLKSSSANVGARSPCNAVQRAGDHRPSRNAARRLGQAPAAATSHPHRGCGCARARERRRLFPARNVISVLPTSCHPGLPIQAMPAMPWHQYASGHEKGKQGRRLIGLHRFGLHRPSWRSAISAYPPARMAPRSEAGLDLSDPKPSKLTVMPTLHSRRGPCHRRRRPRPFCRHDARRVG